MSTFAEGTLQLLTCPTCQAGISLNDKAQFAYPGLTEERRLHIRIGDFTKEDIYVALGQTQVGGAWFSRLVSPSGVQYIYDGTGFVMGGTAATLPVSISNLALNALGPNGITQATAVVPTSGSYDSEIFTPNENGDWYIEFTDVAGFGLPTVSARCPLWDISVVDNSTAANDVINGRLWSQQWGFRSGSGSQTDPGDFLASIFYVYTEPEQIVTAIEIGDLNDPGWGGDWLIACNGYGIDDVAYNNGDAATARQSYDGDADADFGPLNEYKIFVNDPDIIEFPSGVNQITFSSILVDQCGSNNSFITFTTNVDAVGDLTLDFAPFNNNGPEDIPFNAQVINAGANTLPWNELDNLGNPVPAGTSFFIRLFVGGGTVHFPMYDVEGVTGMKARLVRPGTPKYIGLYWDNTFVPVGNPANPVVEVVNPGCVSTATTPCNAYGNSNNITLNMWWNGLETNIADEIVMSAFVPPTVDAGVPAACDLNNVTVVPLNGTSSGVNVVEWTSNGTGTFDDANLLNAVYTPSQADLAAGTVLLTLSSFACQNVVSTALVNVNNTTCILPILLSEFSGSILNRNDHCDGVRVAWTTEVEVNTSHYLLERSADLLRFETVGTIDAIGNPNSPASYTMTDSNISSDNYYRLTAYDFDGTSESFLMKSSIQTDCYEDLDLNSISDLFPNPVYGNELVFMKLNIGEATNATIQVKDVSGRTVRNISTELTEGEQVINFSLEGLDTGIYFINLDNGNWSTRFEKLVKILQ